MASFGRYATMAVLMLAGSTSAFAANRRVVATSSPYAMAASIAAGAARGSAVAEARMGWLYLKGRGVPQDFHLAAKWFYRAAVQGEGFAQYQLAMLYNKGQGVPRDYLLAYMWLNLSASQAVGEDGDFKARMRDAIASKMTDAQIKAAQRMAVSWYRAR
jgi:uncharacterized protein